MKTLANKKSAEFLRENYPEFHYHGYSIDKQDSGLTVKFRHSTGSDLHFESTIAFPSLPDSWRKIPQDALNNLIFNLGIIDLFSYWKATCSPKIIIHAGQLDSFQLKWWKEMLIKGMGEYFYVNDIDFRAEEFVNFECNSSSETEPACYIEKLPERSLIPIGGGRDSALTLKLLQKEGFDFRCMVMNEIPAALNIAAAVTRQPSLIVERKLDPLLFKLNKDGFLNGHTPFSAYLAFLNAACLALYGYSNVIIANERSSDEGNVMFHGEQINHQYSKSFEFETRFDEYLQRYLVRHGRYFSLMRPLYEIRIGKMFSQYSDLFTIFKSCNKMQKIGSWCGECPKCLAVFITMYPFISKADLLKIFGRDFFENESSIQIIRELAGLETAKPFECVTTTEESKAALYLCLQKSIADGGLLPIALLYAKDNIIDADDNLKHSAGELLAATGETGRIPGKFLELITD